MLKYLGQMLTSLLLMTATCSRRLERKLFDQVGRQVYRVMRQATDHHEIVHRMISMSSINMQQAVADKIASLMSNFGGADWALLFCWSRKECDHMAMLELEIISL